MINKKDSSDPIDNLEYEKVLEEEIINSYESKFLKDPFLLLASLSNIEQLQL